MFIKRDRVSNCKVGCGEGKTNDKALYNFHITMQRFHVYRLKNIEVHKGEMKQGTDLFPSPSSLQKLFSGARRELRTVRVLCHAVRVLSN